jgi:hypothetical protein
MAEGSDQGPKEIGPSYKKDMKGENDEADAPRRTRLRILATVGAAMIAISAIAVTTWALANRGDDAKAGPDTEDPTSTASVPDELKFWDPDGVPTVPPTTPSTLPSFPTLDDPTLPTPSTFPTPSVPYSTTTAPAYTPPAYTPPATTPPTTAPTTTPTTTPPAPTEVRPVAPRETRITRCGTFGSLRIVKTTGVRYERTVGDGREGRWVVRASARKGYVVASGAKTRWEGNLGRFRPCPGDPYIDGVESTHTGESETDPWDVAVTTVVPGKESRELEVTYAFSSEVSIVEHSGAGWSCEDAEELEPGVPIACTFDYTGQAPPAVILRVAAVDDEGNTVQPHGGVTLATDGTIRDTGVF